MEAYEAIRKFNDEVLNFYENYNMNRRKEREGSIYRSYFIVRKLPEDTFVLVDLKKINMLAGYQIDGVMNIDKFIEFINNINNSFNDTDFKVSYMLKNHGNDGKLYEVQFIYLRKKEENR